MGRCKWCRGKGECRAPGDTRWYVCQDCGGAGFIPECEICGNEYEGDYCESCFAECKECGDVFPIHDMTDSLCKNCSNERIEA